MTGVSPPGWYQHHRELRLACGHQLTYPKPEPSPGDLVWCTRCDAGRVVADDANDANDEGRNHHR